MQSARGKKFVSTLQASASARFRTGNPVPLGQLTTEFELVELFEWEGGYQAIFDIIVPDGVGADGVRNWAIGAGYLGDGDYTQSWAIGIDATVDVIEVETAGSYSGAYLFDTIGEDFQLVFEAGDRIRIAAKVDGASYSAGDFEIHFSDFDATFTDLQEFVSIVAAPTTVYETSFTQEVTLENADLGWPVVDWNIFFDVPDELVNATVSSVWGASVTQNAVGDLLFSAPSRAGSFDPGETQGFGFTMDYERANPFVLADSGVTFSDWPPVQGDTSGGSSSSGEIDLIVGEFKDYTWDTEVPGLVSRWFTLDMYSWSGNPIEHGWYVDIDIPDDVEVVDFEFGSLWVSGPNERWITEDEISIEILEDGDLRITPNFTELDAGAGYAEGRMNVIYADTGEELVRDDVVAEIVYAPDPDEQAVLADPATALSVDDINFNSWGNGLGANFAITNDADLPVDGWSVVIDIPDGVDIDPMQVWGANAEMLENGDMRLTAADYRSYIDAGETIRVGFTAGYQGAERISELTADDFAFDPLDQPEADPAEALDARFYNGEDWGDGLIQRVAVENTGTDDVDGWRVVIDIPEEVDVTLTSVWGSAIGRVNGDGDLVFVSKVGDSVVEVGEDARFGFTLDYAYDDDLNLDFTSSDFVFVPDDYAFA